MEGLRAAARQGEELGVTLCIEPLNRFETYFLNTQEDAARLVREVGAHNVRVHFDTFHANIEGRHPANSVRAISKELGHVHISENDRGIPGTGHVDRRGVLTALKEIEYNGWMTIESFAEPGPELAAAAAIWRDLAPSGDELARRRLQFIKSLSRKVGIWWTVTFNFLLFAYDSGHAPQAPWSAGAIAPAFFSPDHSKR